MSTTPRGQVLSSQEPGVRQATDDFADGFLAYDLRILNIVEAAERHPESALTQVYAGFLAMFDESPAGRVSARRYLARAQLPSVQLDAREAGHVALLQAWVDGDIPSALRAADALTDRFPRDLVITKLAQYLAFNRGDVLTMLRAILKVLDVNADVAAAHGMAAFAWEQANLLTRAERAARQALALQPSEPWAQHALAHVCLTQGRVDEGTRLLEQASAGWQGLNSFMSTHLWWHLALFYLARGREAEALRIHDQHVWGVAKGYSQDQAGAVQLLARLELAGVDVGDRWQDVADHIAARGADTEQPYLSLLYLYGLARARRPQAADLLAALRDQAGSAADHDRDTWLHAVLPAAQGLVALAAGEHQAAHALLSRAQPGLSQVGGSHAQRDLFTQWQLHAALRSAQWLPVQQALEARRWADADDVQVNQTLAVVYDGVGLTALATQARERVQAVRAQHARVGRRAQD